MTRLARLALIVLLYFCALSALAGGVLGVAANGAGVPLEYLRATPFPSYLIPGLILGVVVGGTQALAAVAMQRRHPYGLVTATVAGFGMLIWIFVEVAITGYFWLQTLYFALGVGELLLVLLVLGVLSPPTGTRVPRSSGRRG
jgi:hypothetical protein